MFLLIKIKIRSLKKRERESLIGNDVFFDLVVVFLELELVVDLSGDFGSVGRDLGQIDHDLVARVFLVE